MSRIVVACLLCTVYPSRFVKADDATVANFRRHVRAVLMAACYPCHGPNKGRIRFDQLDPDLINGPDAETWHDALDQVNLGEMPPAKAKQLTADQRGLLTDWML